MLRRTVADYVITRSNARCRHARRRMISPSAWHALLVLLVAVGCGASPAELSERGGSTRDAACPPEETTAISWLNPDDPGFQDVETYAEMEGVPIEEAVRRMALQEDPSLKRLQPELMAKERDTFAGLWIQHQPEYRYVVLFTEGGEETIQPYLECNPHADVVEVRNGADATLAQLSAAHEEAARITDRLGIPTDSGTQVSKNRVEFNVTDRAALEAALQDAGERLPEHVVVVEVEGLAQPAVPDAGDYQAPADQTRGDRRPVEQYPREQYSD